MVRGHAKDVARERNAKKSQDEGKKRTGAESAAVKAATQAIVCSFCKQGCATQRGLLEHFQNKHPKLQLPPELAALAAGGTS